MSFVSACFREKLRLLFFLLYSLNFLQLPAYAQVFKAEDVLTEDAIERIIQHKTYFQNINGAGSFLDSDSSLPQNAKDQFLKIRNQSYSYEAILERILRDGLAVHYQNEKLCMADAQCHMAFASLVPSLTVSLDMQGMTHTFFKNMFGFLVPKNWFKLADSKKSYQISQYIFLKEVLDESFNTEVLYLNIHKILQEYQILKYFLANLDILSRNLTQKNNSTTYLFARQSLKLEMELDKRRDTLSNLFSQLNIKINPEAEAAQHRHVTLEDSLNIQTFGDKTKFIKQAEQFTEEFADKDKFLTAVLDRSIELRSVNALYKLAAEDPRIVAVGNMLSDSEDGLGLSLSYSIIPKLMVVRSRTATAELDVKSEVLKLVYNARVAHNLVVSSLRTVEKSNQAISMAQAALEAVLDEVLKGSQEFDPLFNRLDDLLATALDQNLNIHALVESLAIINRLLVTKSDDLVRFLPRQKDIQKTLDMFVGLYQDNIKDKHVFIDNILRKIHKANELSTLLAGSCFYVEGLYYNFSVETLKGAVQRNIHNLLAEDKEYPKSSCFFGVLKLFINKHSININQEHRDFLNTHSCEGK